MSNQFLDSSLNRPVVWRLLIYVIIQFLYTVKAVNLHK